MKCGQSYFTGQYGTKIEYRIHVIYRTALSEDCLKVTMTKNVM